MRFQEEGREWRLPGFLYADDLVLCSESEEDLRVTMERFGEVCRRRGVKVNAGKSKGMVLGEEEELECEVFVDGIHLEHVSEFKYLGCVLDESGTDDAECSRKVASGRRVAGAMKALVNDRDLQLECAILHDSLMVPVLTYGSETVIWREKEWSRIRDVQIYNLRGVLGIRRMAKFSECMDKALVQSDEKIDEGVPRWFGHVERMENGKIPMRVYVGECAGSRSVDMPRKRWIDTV